VKLGQLTNGLQLTRIAHREIFLGRAKNIRVAGANLGVHGVDALENLAAGLSLRCDSDIDDDDAAFERTLGVVANPVVAQTRRK